ncbi:hypothetical protein [Roseibium sediminis]|nr:hypothetical protein [Roseibium sediminis]
MAFDVNKTKAATVSPQDGALTMLITSTFVASISMAFVAFVL